MKKYVKKAEYLILKLDKFSLDKKSKIAIKKKKKSSYPCSIISE
jgi:hypothetical protein